MATADYSRVETMSINREMSTTGIKISTVLLLGTLSVQEDLSNRPSLARSLRDIRQTPGYSTTSLSRRDAPQGGKGDEERAILPREFLNESSNLEVLCFRELPLVNIIPPPYSSPFGPRHPRALHRRSSSHPLALLRRCV